MVEKMGMVRNIWVVQIYLVVFVAEVVVPSFAATYYVGDSYGWQTPANGFNYSNWAFSKTFFAGDVLVFNFVTGQHSAAKVVENDYVICNTATPLAIETTGPATYTLSPGPSFFICTIPGHCPQGQKLEVNAYWTAPPPPRSSAPPPAALVASSLMFLPIFMITFLVLFS